MKYQKTPCHYLSTHHPKMRNSLHDNRVKATHYPGLEKPVFFYKKKTDLLGFFNKTRVLLGFMVFFFGGGVFENNKKNSFTWRLKDKIHVLMCPYGNNTSHFVI